MYLHYVPQVPQVSLRAGIREQDAGSFRRQVKKKSEATGKKEILKKK